MLRAQTCSDCLEELDLRGLDRLDLQGVQAFYHALQLWLYEVDGEDARQVEALRALVCALRPHVWSRCRRLVSLAAPARTFPLWRKISPAQDRRYQQHVTLDALRAELDELHRQGQGLTQGQQLVLSRVDRLVDSLVGQGRHLRLVGASDVGERHG